MMAVSYEELMEKKLDRIDDRRDKRQGSLIYDALAPNAAETAQFYADLDLLADRTFAPSCAFGKISTLILPSVRSSTFSANSSIAICTVCVSLKPWDNVITIGFSAVASSLVAALFAPQPARSPAHNPIVSSIEIAFFMSSHSFLLHSDHVKLFK